MRPDRRGHFPAVERVAIDPLEPYFGSSATLTALREPTVEYRHGVAEALPCESERYDVAIIENCIDHVRDVSAAMRDLKRVLSATGVLYLTVNCRARWGFLVHSAMAGLRVDAGHPHTFTPRRVHRLLRENGFRPCLFETDSPAAARRADLAAPERRARLKALLGVSEFRVSTLAQHG